jgi:hypothetical protein
MRIVIVLALIICLGLPVAARGQTAGEDYMGHKMLKKQPAPSSAEELGPMSVPYPPNPYPCTPEGSPMIEEELPAYQGKLRELGEEPDAEGKTGKKVSEPAAHGELR